MVPKIGMNVQDAPRGYLSIPGRLRKKTKYAAAALLGLASFPLVVRPNDRKSSPTKEEKVLWDISKRCSNVLKHDPSLLRQLLASTNAVDFLNFVLLRAPQLLSNASWDRDLAFSAVQKAPLCYLLLPEFLLHDSQLASGFHQLLISGDATTLRFILNKKEPLIDKIVWNRDLALKAVRATPKLYLYLPRALTNNDKELGSTFHQLLVSGDQATIDLLLNRKQPLIDRVVWDRELALQAVRTTPKLYFYLPPSLTNNDKELASSFHKGLVSGDKDTIEFLLNKLSPTIDKVVWDRELALQAVRTTPKLYLYLPPSLTNNDKELASIFHDHLVAGDSDIINILFDKSSPLIDKVVWDRELALKAAHTTPKFYQHLPVSLRGDDIELAVAVILSPRAEIRTVLTEVKSCCNVLFSNPEALMQIFRKGEKDIIKAMVLQFKIDWNQDLAKAACECWPPSYHYLPASFRDDNVDAHCVMSSLLPLESGSAIKAAVDNAISSNPGFFTDPDAVEQLFLEASCSEVVGHVLRRASGKIPWDRELTRVAARRCNEGGNFIVVAIKNMYILDSGLCKHHLPLGMLLSDDVVYAATDWPEVLNKCRCSLERDDSVLIEVWQFVVLMLRKLGLSREKKSWLSSLVRQIRKEYFQNREIFETFLFCISVADGGPLESLKGNDEMRVSLKRSIAEFIGAPIGRIKRAKMKRDVLKLMYGLLTLPGQFRYRDISQYSFEEVYSFDETSYWLDCFRLLSRLKERYGDGKLEEDNSLETDAISENDNSDEYNSLKKGEISENDNSEENNSLDNDGISESDKSEEDNSLDNDDMRERNEEGLLIN